MTEIIFEVIESDDGGFEARVLGYSIFTQGADWYELKEMAKEAVFCHFGEAKTPRVIRLQQVRDGSS